MLSSISAASRRGVSSARLQGQATMRVLSTGLNAEATESQYVLPTYGKDGLRARQGLVFSHGEGNYLVDTKGERYLDMSAGIAVNCLGHGNKEWVSAVSDQLSKLVHVSNLYHTEPYLRVAEKLVKMSPGFSKVFFCNSGTEANEGALKFARLLANHRRKVALATNGSAAAADSLTPDRRRFIAFKQSFHGRSLGALSVTWKPAVREPFAPMLMHDVTFVPFNDLAAVRAAMGPDVCAVIVEPVQGEGGVTPAFPSFLSGLRELCDQHGASLICDEIQIGLGRSGNGDLYGHQAYDIVPDFMTLAKPLAGGLPIGAVLVSEDVINEMPPSAWLGMHGTTFGANPVVCRAAEVVLERLDDPSFRASVAEAGERLVTGLRTIALDMPRKVKEVRAPLGDKALYAGVQFHKHAQVGPVVAAALEKNVMVIGAGDNGDVLRLCPPLCLTLDEVDAALVVLRQAIETAVPDFEVVADADAEPTPSSSFAPCEWPETFGSKEEYLSHLSGVGQLPDGFKVGTAALNFFPLELGEPGISDKPAKMDVTMIALDEPTNEYAAVFTKNTFPGSPIVVGREMIRKGQKLGGVVVNNKISNVHPAGNGVQAAMSIVNAARQALNITDPDVGIMPSSTGVIGWRLPVTEMLPAVEQAALNLTGDANAGVAAAQAIMTTDTFPKLRSATVTLADGSVGRIVGVAKGAGMIEPHLATMLVFIMTDIKLVGGAKAMQECLESSVNAPGSFNRITVDSDQSTSDTVLVMSSSKVTAMSQADNDAFKDALTSVCNSLATDVVRNGEGTQHVMSIRVSGAPSDLVAHGCAKAIANSPLVKTAVAGNDPNVGRILGALGSYLGLVAPDLAARAREGCVMKIGGVQVFGKGEFMLDGEKERALIKMLKQAELPEDAEVLGYPTHSREVEIEVDLGCGDATTCVRGSDLTHGYVSCNAEYRS